MGILHLGLCKFITITRRILLKMRNIADTVKEKVKTHFLYSITLFRKSCLLRDNVEKSGTVSQATDDNITRRMRFAC